MKPEVPPPVDPRGEDALFIELAARARSYVPDVRVPGHQVATSIGKIAARYAWTVFQRLNRAPEKHRLAFYATAGLQLTPAQAARAPVIFTLNDSATAGSAPAGTGVAAPPPPGATEQIMFETETPVGVGPGRILQVASVWPARDEYVDHSSAVVEQRPFTLFDPDAASTIPHELYLSHEALLALSGKVRLGLEVQMLQAASQTIDVRWEYWDGKNWRGFLEPFLPVPFGKSGTIELIAEGATSEITTVAGAAGYWIRGRVAQPLPPDVGSKLPEIDSIRITSVVEQPLRATLRTTPTPSDIREAIALFNSAGQFLGGASATAVLRDTTPGSTQPDLLITLKEFEPGKFRPPQIPDSRYRMTSITVSLAQTSAQLADDDPPILDKFSAAALILSIAGVKPDKAFADGEILDTTKPFFPLGQQPKPGNTFYFSCAEAFSKPGAGLRIYLPVTAAASTEIRTNDTKNRRTVLPHLLAWEYWNGRSWAALSLRTDPGLLDFETTVTAEFAVPLDMRATRVNDQEALWMRVRLVSGGFGFKQEIQWQAGTGSGAPVNSFEFVMHQPPALADICIGYTWQHGPLPPDRVIAYNDFAYIDRTNETIWPGVAFAPYVRTADTTPVLYVGLDKKPPVDALGILFNIVERRDQLRGPELAWEYWNGAVWQQISSVDETQQLRVPGIVTTTAQPDNAALARFGTPLYWLRARMKEDGVPGHPEVTGIWSNAVWASQQRTLRDVVIGDGSGNPGHVFAISQTPMNPGERVEVREVFGLRAAIEWRIVALELSQGDTAIVRRLEEAIAREGTQDVVDGDLRLKRDRQKRVSEVWVRWDGRESLDGSGPRDRHLAIDRARGLLVFGDDVHGRILPLGASVVARVLKTGGGRAGNVAARTLTQLAGVLPGIQSVSNPLPAEGGADGETVELFSRRAPSSLSHRGRAVSVEDYAALALDSSAAIAYARGMRTTTASGQRLAGYVTVIVAPHSQDPAPQPSFSLRQHVLRYIERRAPADMVGGIAVMGPDYQRIDVSATVAVRTTAEGGAVERRAREALLAFLHPVYGGPSNDGWQLGRGVFLSDVAAVLERVDGVDYVAGVELLGESAPQTTSVEVRDGALVAAGTIRIKVLLAEG